MGLISYETNHDTARVDIDDLTRFVYARALSDEPRPNGERALFAEYMVDIAARRHDITKRSIAIEWLDVYADKGVDVPTFTVEMKWYTNGLYSEEG